MGPHASVTTDGLRRRTLLVSLAAAGFAAGTVRAATLPAPGSLASALALALRNGQPLLVLASTDGCAWCKLVRDNYLDPLRRDQGLQAVQLDLGSRAGLVDFDGAAATHDELLRRWRVQVAPTLLFFGREGREVASRLVGVAPDFYGAYLDQRLATARRSLA